MKYIKENNNYYQEIDRVNYRKIYGSLNKIEFTDQEKEIVTNLISNLKRFSRIKYEDKTFTIEAYDDKKIWLEKYEDEWYTAEINVPSISKKLFYKCDQFDGMIKLLKEKI